ncbi:hypothetical protein PENTCL1PPCAC_11974, partial [Pristionchus entomophagus]
FSPLSCGRMLFFLLFLLSSNLVSSFNPHSLTNPLKHVDKRYDWSFTKDFNGWKRTCEWFGDAPIWCNKDCPEGYQEVDRQSRVLENPNCKEDPHFGNPCDIGTNARCCKR